MHLMLMPDKPPYMSIFQKSFSNSLIIHDGISQPERPIRVRWLSLKLDETPVENHQCFITFSSLVIKLFFNLHIHLLLKHSLT